MSSSDGDFTRPKKSKVKKEEGLWLMSFSDMVLNLMCFFILLLSFTKVDKNRFEHVTDGMNAKKEAKKQENLHTMEDKLQAMIKETNLEKSVEVKYDAQGLKVEFKDALLFGSGSADSNSKVKPVVGSVMNLIAKAPPRYNIVIEGHTDEVPIKSKQYRSNWELAADRGFTIMRQFKEKGVNEKRISVVSYAHTRPKVSYLDKKGVDLEAARSANRRVVIRIE